MGIRHVAPISLVLLTAAGGLKLMPALAALPVDLTLLAFALVVLFTAVRLVTGKFRIPRDVILPSLLIAVLIPPAMLSSWSQYSAAKVALLFTITATCLVAPAMLVRAQRDVHAMLVTVASAGLVLAAATLTGFAEAGRYDRVSAFGASPLHAASFGGAVAVLATLYGMNKLGRPLIALPAFGAALASVVAVVASGTRAALGGILLSLVVTLLCSRQSTVRRGAQIAIAVPAIALALAVGLRVAPDGATNRIENFAGDFSADRSSAVRQVALGESLVITLSHPLGVGIGDWSEHASPAIAYLQYPHNLLAEVAVEAGWLPVAVLAAYLATAFRQARRYSGTAVGRMMLGLLTFLASQALTRGDITDHRLLFVIASTCLVLPRLDRSSSMGSDSVTSMQRDTFRVAAPR